MRTIKFRAWDGDDYMSSPFDLFDLQERKVEFGNDAVIMQFTGLHDKNGEEIYEGDANNIGVVKFAEGAFWLDLFSSKETFLLREVASLHEFNLNIYENPELIPTSPDVHATKQSNKETK